MCVGYDVYVYDACGVCGVCMMCAMRVGCVWDACGMLVGCIVECVVGCVWDAAWGVCTRGGADGAWCERME